MDIECDVCKGTGLDKELMDEIKTDLKIPCFNCYGKGKTSDNFE